MNCPEYLIFKSRWLWIWHWQRADVRRQYVTWGEVLNPLRYEINLRWGQRGRLIINDEAWLNRVWDKITWRLYRRRLWERKHNRKENDNG